VFHDYLFNDEGTQARDRAFMLVMRVVLISDADYFWVSL
jgi:hypothetical protein